MRSEREFDEAPLAIDGADEAELDESLRRPIGGSIGPCSGFAGRVLKSAWLRRRWANC